MSPAYLCLTILTFNSVFSGKDISQQASKHNLRLNSLKWGTYTQWGLMKHCLLTVE